MKKCPQCGKWLAECEFGTHLVKGVAVTYALCPPCRKKHKERNNRYARGAKGKAVSKVYDQSAKGKVVRKRAMLKYESSAAGKTARKQYRQSDARKVVKKRYEQSDKGKAAYERQKKLRNARFRARYAMDPAYNLMHRIKNSVCAFLADRKNVAGIFEANVDLSSSDLHEWIDAQLKAKGLKWSDYGITWEIEHKIPQEMYDFSDPADVKRCWSFRNVHVMSPEENKAKGNKLLDEIAKDVPAEEYPASWNGVYLATEEAKQAKYAAIKAKKAVYKPKAVYGPYLEKIEKELAEKAAKKAAKAAAAAAASRLSSEADTSSSDSSDESDDESSDSDDESDDQPPAPAPLSKATGKRKAEPSYAPPPSASFVDSSDDEG